jgi:predicted Zn-dependent protease
MRRKWVLVMGVVAVSLGFLIGCTTAPVTGRKQLSLVSADQMTQLGLSEFDKLKQDTPISKDPEANAMVQRVGKRIAAVASRDLPDAQWEFVVFESKEANAFCLPGGKVGVYTGILPITKDDEGLATVLGHEIAHAAAHHGAERMSHELAAQTGTQLAGVALSGTDPRIQSLASVAFPALAQVGVLLPFSRKEESEADHIGLVYMARAGYDPRAAVAFWERFSDYNKANGGDSGIALLRTHPVDSDRIADLKKWLPEAEAAARGINGSSTVGNSIISSPAK